MTDAPGEAVDEYEAGCRRSDESAGVHGSTFPFGGWQAPLLDEVAGSLNLVQNLLREKLFDRLDLWVHPVVLGVGKKVFDGGAVPTDLTLLEPPVASSKGTVYLRYGLADGTPGTGDTSAPDRGAGRDS
nr:dihydrofolate reductase family protein [Frankia tisae]